MNQIAKTTDNRSVSPQDQFRSEVQRMGDQFVAALPEHIKPEKFQRTILTAVLGDPNLLKADRKSLLESAMRAAQDGLLPDKREGAFVVFNTKMDGSWVKAVQWMPMIGGIIKKLHQSGDVALITAKVVYGGDDYRTWVDDNGEHIAYQPAENPDYDTIRQVFAMAKMKDGAVYVEALTTRDIEKIRQVSRSKDKGPWVDWWEEMAKKSAIRRLAKRLNLTPEIHDLIQRDNAMYDLSRAPEPRPSMASKLGGGVAGEGFSQSYITQAIDNEPAIDAGPAQVVDEAPEQDPAPASSHGGADSDGAGESSPSAPSPQSQAESDTQAAEDAPPPSRMLLEAVQKMFEMTQWPDSTDQERMGLVEKVKDQFKPKLPDHEIHKFSLVFTSCQEIIRGNVEYETSTGFYSEMLGHDVSAAGERVIA